VATVIAASLLTATGCAGGADPADGPGPAPEPTAPAELTPEPSDPTSEPEPTEPEPEPTEPTPEPAGLRAALLPASSLPVPGDAPAWTLEGTVRGEGPDLVSVCQRTALANVGATRTVTRQYSSGDLSATHLVARFGDDVSAGRTYEVLQSWWGQCSEQLEQQDLEPGRIPSSYTDMPGVGDRAGWSWLSYGPVPGDPDAANIEVQALVHGDETLSWVIWRQVGQDYNYPPGQTPPERALPLMADRLPH